MKCTVQHSGTGTGTLRSSIFLLVRTVPVPYDIDLVYYRYGTGNRIKKIFPQESSKNQVPGMFLQLLVLGAFYH